MYTLAISSCINARRIPLALAMFIQILDGVCRGRLISPLIMHAPNLIMLIRPIFRRCMCHSYSSNTHIYRIAAGDATRGEADDNHEMAVITTPHNSLQAN